MVDPAAAAKLPLDVLNFVPEFCRKIVDWRDTLDANPSQVELLRDEISSVQEQLSILSTFTAEWEQSDESVECKLFGTRLKASRKRADSLMKMCRKLSKSLQIGKMAYKMFPKQIEKKVTAIKSELSEVNSSLQSLEECSFFETLRSQQSSEFDNGGDGFKVVHNIGLNPREVILDFDSLDATGEPLTYEGKLKAALLDESTAGRVRAITVLGMGGLGKTCAVRGIGLLEKTEQRFPGGIFFVEIGAESGRSRLIQEIAKMIRLSGGEEEAKQILPETKFSDVIEIAGEWFKDRGCLFILDDLWLVRGIDLGMVEELSNLARNEKSRVVLTTRDRSMVFDEEFEIKERVGLEARKILLHCAKFYRETEEPMTPETEKAFRKILADCKGLPLALAIAGRGIRRLLGVMENEEDAWVEYAERMDRKEACWEYNVSQDDKDQALVRSLKLSLELMQEVWGEGCCIRELFESLCILQKQQSVLHSVFSRTWDLRNTHEVERLMDMFERFSVARVWYSRANGRREGFVSLHDKILDICRAMSGRHGMIIWTRRVLQSYFDAEEGRSESLAQVGTDRAITEEWKARLRRSIARRVDEGYEQTSTGWLLRGAELGTELIHLLTDGKWVVSQILTNGEGHVGDEVENGVQCIKDGFTTLEQEEMEGATTCLRAIERAVFLSKSENDVKWDGFVYFQLYGRMQLLAQQNRFARAFTMSLEAEAPRPWIRPSVGCLPSASSTLSHVVPLDGEVLFSRIVGSVIEIGYERNEGVYLTTYDMEGREHGERELFMKLDKSKGGVRCGELSQNGEHVVFSMRSGEVIVASKQRGESCDCRNAGRREGKGSSEVSEKGRRRWVHEVIGKHNGFVTSVHISGDGRCVASGSEDAMVGVWERKGEGWNHSKLGGHTRQVTSVCLCRDAQQVVSGSWDGTVRLWEREGSTWVSQVLLSHQGEIGSMWACENGRSIVCGSWNGRVVVWRKDGEGWVPSELLGHKGVVISLCGSSDGRRVVSASLDNTMRVWEEGEDGWDCVVLTGDLGKVWMSADGCFLVSGPRFASRFGSVKVWQRGIGGWGHGGVQSDVGILTSVSVSKDGARVVSGHYDGAVGVWEIREGGWGCEVLAGHEDVVRSVWVSESGTQIASGSADGTVRVRQKGSTGVWESEVLDGHTGRVNHVWISGDGMRVVSCSDDKTVRVWERRTGGWECEILEGHATEVYNMSVNADGTRVVSGSWHGTILLWKRGASGWDSVNLTFLTEMRTVESVSVSGDGGQVAVASWDETFGYGNRTVQVWEEKQGVWKGEVVTQASNWRYCFVWMSSEGRELLILSGDGIVMVWRKRARGWERERVVVGVAVYLEGALRAVGQGRWQQLWTKRAEWTAVMEAVEGGVAAMTRRGFFMRLPHAPYFVHLDWVDGADDGEARGAPAARAEESGSIIMLGVRTLASWLRPSTGAFAASERSD